MNLFKRLHSILIMLNVVKIGGNVIDDEKKLSAFLREFAAISGPKIIVHGGGKEATRLSKELGVRTTMIDGRRVTDRETLDIVTMVYAGLVNKRVVASLQALGCDAVGLTGADGNSIPASRRDPKPVDFGYVGDIEPAAVNIRFISSLIEEDRVPVFCAVCHDREGTLLNCNADSVASAVAIGMSSAFPVRLTYCFEKPGVLRDVNDDDTVIPFISPVEFESLKEDGVIDKGMLPKISNALGAALSGVSEVRICRAEDLNFPGGTVLKST